MPTEGKENIYPTPKQLNEPVEAVWKFMLVHIKFWSFLKKIFFLFDCQDQEMIIQFVLQSQVQL